MKKRLQLNYRFDVTKDEFSVKLSAEDEGVINYVCEDENNQKKFNVAEIDEIIEIQEIKENDGKFINLFKQQISIYAVTGDDSFLDKAFVHIKDNSKWEVSVLDKLNSNQKLSIDELKNKLVEFVKSKDISQKCAPLYKDYFNNESSFLNEYVFHINLLPGEKQFSITVYEEEDGKNNLYTIEYNEDKDGVDFETLKTMNEKKRIMVGEIMEEESDDLFRIFNKGEIKLNKEIRAPNNDKIKKGERKQIIHKFVYEGLRYNEKTFFCRMRTRNCFDTYDENGNHRNYYSGSWNIKKLDQKCESKDIISEFNPDRRTISEKEKKYSDKTIDEKYKKNYYSPKDFEGNIQYWFFSENDMKTNTSDKEILGRRYIDFYNGGNFTGKEENEPIDENKIVEKHCILLLARFILSEEGHLPNSIWDESLLNENSQINYDRAFMKLKSLVKDAFFKEINKSDYTIEFNKIIPYLIFNVYTNYANRIGFDDKGDNGQFVLEDLLTKDEIILI